MSANIKTLLTIAAELRASGHSWEAVAKRVNRKAKTCKAWPRVYAREWQPIYREIQLQRFDQMAQECRDRLRILSRHEDPKIQRDACALMLKHGVPVYGRNGPVPPPAAPVEEAKPASPVPRKALIWLALIAALVAVWSYYQFIAPPSLPG